MSAGQRVVYYAACSVDGFIATQDGGVEWLSDFGGDDGGYEEFFAGVGSLVLGRATFDQVLGWGWPYGEKPSAVLTSRPLPDDAPASAFAVAGDDLAGVVARLRANAPGAVWVVGGGRAAGAFLAAGLLDELELGVIPVVLGAGIPLLPDGVGHRKLELVRAEGRPSGMVSVLYRVAI
ncbi:MAG TPA: dihydrofolate reductase family protein [Gaiellaceae bacterium]|nr:dihydrofolate reductase family protein [Gaiellaceae bacterium]